MERDVMKSDSTERSTALAVLPESSRPAGARRFPAAFTQQKLWFLDQLKPGNVSYLIPWSLRITGELDVAALERGLNEIVRRHDTLRTTLALAGDELEQVIAESLTLELPVLDLSRNPDPV